MMYLLAATLLIGFVTADTNVSVIECGHSGTVRSAIGGRNGLGSTVGDVGSFWSNLHNFQQSRRDGRKSRREHRAGFSLVADHFNKPAGGLAVSLVGEAVDMNMFPQLSAYLKSSESVVGSFNMAGSQSGLLETIVGGETNILKVNEAVGVIRSKVDEFRKRGDNMIESVEINVDNTDSAAEIDGELSALLGSLSEEDGKTVVLHLIVDETAKSRRRLAERRLEDEQNEDQEEDKDEEEEDKDDENEDEENNNDADDGNGYVSKSSSSFYGYGYYDDNGDWQTNYRTIFQIQYYQTCLWTSIGLFAVTFAAINFMINMPLLPDTLLFGESAKMVGE